MLLGVARW
jgi:hypothetical protein